MNNMKILLRYFLIFAGVLTFAGCSEHPDDTTKPASVEFRFGVASYGGEGSETVFDFTQHMNRIYVGERLKEHDSESLHLHEYSDLEPFVWQGQTIMEYNVSSLLPQWYKFAVYTVPMIYPGDDPRNFEIFAERIPGEGSCNMADYFIDYLPILKKGAGATAAVSEMPLPDGDIYRMVMNRWFRSDRRIKENVVLHRVNGLLEVDMGILVDQFYKRVNTVTIELVTPTRLGILDNNVDEVISSNPQRVRFTTSPSDMKPVPEAQRQHHIIRMNLLPCELTDAKIVVDTEGGRFEYKLRTGTGNVFIRKNVRTKLRFNGMADGMFDVRYAGYGNTEIDVEDSWNGGWTKSLKNE